MNRCNIEILEFHINCSTSRTMPSFWLPANHFVIANYILSICIHNMLTLADETWFTAQPIFRLGVKPISEILACICQGLELFFINKIEFGKSNVLWIETIWNICFWSILHIKFKCCPCKLDCMHEMRFCQNMQRKWIVKNVEHCND